MAEESRQGQPPAPQDGGGGDRGSPGQEGSGLRRRDFLIGAGAGVAAAGVVGAGILATRPGTAPPPAAVPAPPPTTAPAAAAQPTAPPQPTAAPQPTAVPQAVAQAQTGGLPVTLKVNGVSRSLTVQPNWT